MGDHGLLDPVRRDAAPGRPPRRRARTQTAVHGRRRGLHGRLAAVRARLVGNGADRHPRGAGTRRRLLVPAALSIVVTTFPEGRERNIALGVWGAASGSGGAVGVLLGGVLTSYLNWSWIFFVNLPVGVAILAVTPWLVSESRAALAQRHFDVSGATSITAGLMVLVYAITRTSEHGWSDGVTLGLLASAAALIAAFVGIEARSRRRCCRCGSSACGRCPRPTRRC